MQNTKHQTQQESARLLKRPDDFSLHESFNRQLDISSEGFQLRLPGKADLSMRRLFLLVNLGELFYTVLQVMTKDLLTNKHVPPFEFSFLRSLFNLCGSSLLVWLRGQRYFADIPRELYTILGLRCIIGTVGFACFAIAMQYVPLSVFFIIFNSNPFCTAILGYFWLQERLSVFEIIAMVCAFSGIVLMSMAQSGPTETFDPTFMLGVSIALVACIGQSFICVASRKLRILDCSVIQFNYALTSTVVMGLCVLVTKSHYHSTPFVYESGMAYLQILVASSFNMMAQNLFTETNQRACPATVGLVAYCGVLYNFLADVLLFHLKFNLLQIVGVSIAIFFSVAAAIYRMVITPKKK